MCSDCALILWALVMGKPQIIPLYSGYLVKPACKQRKPDIYHWIVHNISYNLGIYVLYIVRSYDLGVKT